MRVTRKRARQPHGAVGLDRRATACRLRAGPLISSFISALSIVLVSAVPIVLVAFVLTWFLQETKLRGRDDKAKEMAEAAASIRAQAALCA